MTSTDSDSGDPFRSPQEAETSRPAATPDTVAVGSVLLMALFSAGVAFFATCMGTAVMLSNLLALLRLRPDETVVWFLILGTSMAAALYFGRRRWRTVLESRQNAEAEQTD